MNVDTEAVPSGAHRDAQYEATQRSLTVSAEMVRCLLPEFDQVSITVLDSTGSPYTCASAGDVVADLDRLQYDLHERPCIDSLRGVTSVVAPQIQRGDRWPRYVSSAVELGLSSQVAAPLPWRKDGPVGALNMYSTTRREIASTTLLIAEALAAQVCSALTSFREIENLHRALVTRKSIGAAIGLLMAQHQLNEAAAFAVLQRRSSYANVDLRDVAEQMILEADAAGGDLPRNAVC